MCLLLLKHNGDVGFISNPKNSDAVIRKTMFSACLLYTELRKRNL